MFENKDSINRPAWIQDDLHAYRHKHLNNGRILKDYYVKAYSKINKKASN